MCIHSRVILSLSLFLSHSAAETFSRVGSSIWIGGGLKRCSDEQRDPSDDASTATKMRRSRCVAVTRTFHSTKKRASPGDTNAHL